MSLPRCLVAGALAVLALTFAAPAAALEGRVVDDAGKPLQGARVCYFLAGEEKHCTATDAAGRFDLLPSRIDRIRVLAPGFLPSLLPAIEPAAPIALTRAPSLIVRLVDAASGEAVSPGEVFVLYPSGERKGPFPVSPAGVRIDRVLAPGPVRVTAEAAGYAGAKTVEAMLEPGQETSLVLRLQAAR